MATLHASPNQFWLLCALGVWGLWGFAFFNGMFDRLDIMMKTRLLPDGRALRSQYSGNAFLDERLTLLSGFYDVLTNGLSSGPRLLFLDINFVVACMNMWVLIESRRRGVRNWFLRYPVWIIILWNANGAAIFKPAYFYFLSRSGARSRDATIPVNDAMAVFAVTLPVMACPLLLFVPAWLNYSTWDHHGFIALFHLTPVLIFGLFMIIANVLSATYGTTTEKESKAPSADKPWIIASLTVAGTIAAGVHIFTVLASLKTTDPDATLARLLIPSHGRANPFPSWITTVDSTRKGLPAEYTAMLEECHLFSQYDWIVICLSVILFLRLLRAEPGAEGLDASAKRVEMHWRDCGYLAWGTILFGPGAAGSFALAAQESRTREQAQTNQLQ